MNLGVHITSGIFLLLACAGALVLFILEQRLLSLSFLVCASFFLLVFLLTDKPSDRR